MTRSSSVLSLAFVSLLAPVVLVAQTATDSGPAELLGSTEATVWTKTTLDSTHDVGPYVGVAVDPVTGWPYVTYYDQANGDLRFARYVGSGGYCGPGDSWECDALDATNDNGRYNSIAVTTRWMWSDWRRVAIAYQNVDNGRLKLLTGLCYPPGMAPAQRAPGSISTDCTFNLFEIANGSPPSYEAGRYTSVAYTPGDNVYVAYQTYSATGDESVVVARAVSSTGNCGLGESAGTWQCDTILSGNGIGSYASLAIDSIYPYHQHLAFYDPVNGRPYYAAQIESGGNCGPSNSWLCQTVHTSGRITGRSVSLYVEADGAPHMAYLDTTSATHNQLVYATYVGSGGNCGFSSISLHDEWQCDVIVDDLGNVGTGRTVAIAPDEAGAPMIAYRDASDDFGSPMLKLARPYAAAPGATPNCGPYVDPFYTWVCTTVDVGGTWQDEGAAVAIAANPAGNAIAYHELNTYVLPAEGNLKVAHEIFSLFADNFNSGDVTRWSVHVP